MGLVPSTILELSTRGHQVMVEKGAGVGAGIADAGESVAHIELPRVSKSGR